MPKTVSLSKNQYYEAIFQLRDADEKLIDFVVKQIEEGKKTSASKIVYLRNGTDLYLSSKSFAIGLGRKLQKNFGGTLKISKKLFTKSRKTGKNVYRISVFFKPIPFSVGDVIKVKGKLLKVTGIGKKIGCIELKKGKKTVIEEVGDFEKLKIHKAVVSKTYPKLEVIHPESFQSIAVENQPEKTKNITDAKIVISEEKAYLV